MKVWKKYKSDSLRKQRVLFLLAAILLISLGFMWMPISVEQTGLPDFTKETVMEVSIGGNRPIISTKDPCFTDAELKAVWETIPRLQSALEEAVFYCRLRNPMSLLLGGESWLKIETENGTYRIGSELGQRFVEINGVRRYYRLHAERDAYGAQRTLNSELSQLEDYFIEVNSVYYQNLDY